MSSIVGAYFRRFPRYRIKDHAGTTVTIDTADDSSESRSAQLLDISQGGAKFETHAAIGIKQPISVRIDSTSPRQTLEVDGEISWVKPVRTGTWQLGCAFGQQISLEVLESFARAGILERRRRRRILASLSALAKWELESDEIPISILDYSLEGGFRLMAPASVQPGRRVELRFQKADSDIVVRGKSLWNRATDEGYHIGCEFLTVHDSARFSEILDGLADRVIPGRCWLRTLRRARAVTLVSLLAQRRQVRRVAFYSSVVVLAGLLGTLLIPDTFMSDGVASSSPADVPAHYPSVVDPTGSDPVESDEQSARKPESPAETEAVFTAIAIKRLDTEAETVPQSTSAGTSAHRPRTLALVPPPSDSNLHEPPHWEPVHQLPDSGRAKPVSPRPRPSTVAVPTDAPTSAAPPEPAPTPVLAPSRPDPAQAERATSVRDRESKPPEVRPHDRQAALTQFQEGCRQYHKREFAQALLSLESASQADPTKPLYHYVLALAQFRLQRVEQAEQRIARAATLESAAPLSDWGRQMERYQGPARVWLEHARRQALTSMRAP